jgi:two-component system, cell cycle sensor histidine kinase and response regulator CckA
VQSFDLSRLVEEMVPRLQGALPGAALLRCEPAPGLPPLEADAEQVRQVLLNLVNDAAAALPAAGGVITVRTGLREADRACLEAADVGRDLPPGRYVYLEVADTGPGMDEATRKQLFEPFLTTKWTGRGLGLPAVLGIVRGHQGAIQVETAPGRGTTVRTLFPAAREADRASTSGARGVGGETVLLADDEAAVRDVARRVLEMSGFRVLQAANGREAVELFRRHAGEVRAVLLDLTMPEMGGVESFQALRQLRPDVPVVLMSGYGEQEVRALFAGRSLGGFVQKPFHPEDLLGALERVLPSARETRAPSAAPRVE